MWLEGKKKKVLVSEMILLLMEEREERWEEKCGKREEKQGKMINGWRGEREQKEYLKYSLYICRGGESCVKGKIRPNHSFLVLKEKKKKKS